MPTNNEIEFHPKNNTHKETLLKFLALVLILVGYFAYMSWKYDASTGFGVSVLTWSFFVLCTPIADGGFILAFPIRLLFKVKMSYTQVVLWFVAIAINLYAYFYTPDIYDLTFITQLLKHILSEPYPYWSILIISALGTFLSIYFGDEMMDVASQKDREIAHRHGLKYRTLLVFGLGILTVTAYYYLLSSLGVVLPG
ncbi:hypothetical protein GCM10008107_03570 [Psychrosphaera saromensis]|uniref:Uncharacterized protein n=1 Tax=Psychrosphaera saromensis TaxID=716813 RepID=A0A2S7UXH4_9GAMM|nr:hypothetical protein [Psychrosphaera saromensis]PQJ54694.1 hypothetical protein BTO11_14240 [Psychrosphaera saromensis]GHB57938.1 hypothetical protein GCM10008107_03570 [Psychrosphaera saromensis]GLQ14079.1 hypothetical protein GCM10007917_15340 [Psychrosphaera saromensis]